MDIHKPKPWQGGREFVKEIGTIVIGVLIALGGEQLVEMLHWRHQGLAAEEALRIAFIREVNNAALREAQDACVTERLAGLSSMLRQAADSGRLPPIADIGHPAFTPWTVGAWEALVADQSISHLPRRKAIDYTAIVQQTAYLSALSDREEDQWTMLDSMVGPGHRLSDIEAQQLRTTLAMASGSSVHMHVTSARLRDAVKATGLLAPSDFTEAVQRAADSKPMAVICRPIAAPPA